MEKGGLAKRSSHPLGRYRGMESFRRRKHVLQYGKDRFRQRQHQTAIPHIHREKGDRLSFRPRLCHLRKQQCYLSSRRRQSGEVQPHRILHLSRLRRRAHRQHEPHVSQCRYSCQERVQSTFGFASYQPCQQEVEPMLPRNRRVSARQGDIHHLQHSPQRQRPDYRRFSYLLPGQSTTANGESPRESQRMDTCRWKNLLLDNRLCRQPPQNRPHQHKPHHRRRKALPTAYPNRRNSLRRRHPKRENHSRRIWPY